MFKHQYIRLVYFFALCILIFLEFRYGVPWWVYVFFVLSYLLILIAGSYFIRLHYFTDSLCHGDRKTKAIALTFDDGPHIEHTTKVLDILKEENIRAAFFVIGKHIPTNSSLLQRMINEGHTVGNHSFQHNFWFSVQSSNSMLSDVSRCDEVIEHATGRRPRLFRPPYGVTNPMVAEVIRKGNYISVGWSLRTYDTVAKSPDELLTKTLKKLKNGDVLLLHDNIPHTVGMLSAFIREVKKRGYQIVPVHELLKVNPYD